MVKLATSVLAATLLSVPVLAVASEEYERSLAESDLYGRDFNPEDDAVLLTREDLEDIFGREFVEELEEREPIGFGMISKGFQVLRHGVGHFRHGGSGGHHFRHMGGFSGGGSSGGDNSQQQQQSRRDLGEEFEPEELLSREFVDDLEERGPIGFGMISKGINVFRHGVSHFHHGGSGGHHFRHMGGFSGGGSSGGDNSQQQQQQSRRDLAEEFEPEELLSREFVDDLEEREPIGFGMISKGFHVLRHGVSHFRHGGSGGHHFHHMGGFSGGGSSGGDNSQQQQQQQSRRDLEGYGYYDELD